MGADILGEDWLLYKKRRASTKVPESRSVWLMAKEEELEIREAELKGRELRVRRQIQALVKHGEWGASAFESELERLSLEGTATVRLAARAWMEEMNAVQAQCAETEEA